MPIELKLNGFDELLSDIEKAGGSAVKAAESAVSQSAQILQSELKAEMAASGVSTSLINRMPKFTVWVNGNEVTGVVGYDKGSYDPNNPSDGYKAIFLNYGTPHRSKHGKVKARGFIGRAKKKARPKIRKQEEIALKKILGRLQK